MVESAMAVGAGRVRDWTYHGARLRLLRAGGIQLPHHTATPRLDDLGNRIVDCRCGWTGNGVGWITHIDGVLAASLQD
jgi:hypothetical protein